MKSRPYNLAAQASQEALLRSAQTVLSSVYVEAFQENLCMTLTKQELETLQAARKIVGLLAKATKDAHFRERSETDSQQTVE